MLGNTEMDESLSVVDLENCVQTIGTPEAH